MNINELMKQAVVEVENTDTRNLLIRASVEITSLKMKLETTKKQLDESREVIELTLYDIQNCGFISFIELRLKSFLAKLSKEEGA